MTEFRLGSSSGQSAEKTEDQTASALGPVEIGILVRELVRLLAFARAAEENAGR
jgi:hypothetical protein